jgi:hypothetical protein
LVLAVLSDFEFRASHLSKPHWNVPRVRSGGELVSRGLSISVACLVAAWAGIVPLALGAEEPKGPKIVASGSDSDPFLVRLKKDDSAVVLRSAQELVAHSSKPDSAKDLEVRKEMESALAKFLKLESIDWSKQMVLAVRGVPGTKADRVHFDSLRVEGSVHAKAKNTAGELRVTAGRLPLRLERVRVGSRVAQGELALGAILAATVTLDGLRVTQVTAELRDLTTRDLSLVNPAR